jgi:hypothetical protein
VGPACSGASNAVAYLTDFAQVWMAGPGAVITPSPFSGLMDYTSLSSMIDYFRKY